MQTPSTTLTSLLFFWPAARQAVAAHDFGRRWTGGDTIGEAVEGLRRAGLICRALEVATAAVAAAAFEMGVHAVAAQNPTAVSARATRHECHRLLPPRPRGAEPTPYMREFIRQANLWGIAK